MIRKEQSTAVVVIMIVRSNMPNVISTPFAKFQYWVHSQVQHSKNRVVSSGIILCKKPFLKALIRIIPNDSISKMLY
jgi:hypothetical protein